MSIDLSKMPKLGFGLMRLPQKDNEIDIQQVCRMADAYLEAGMNYFDTAYVYHGGNSEKAVKEALAKRHPRDSYMVATKLPAWCLKTKEDRDRVFNEQLERCGLEYFDFYLLHSLEDEGNGPAYEKLDCYSWGLQKKAEGKIRHFGFSFHGSPAYLARVLDEYRELAKEEKVLAIGEIGLDYYYGADEKEIQRVAFEKQLRSDRAERLIDVAVDFSADSITAVSAAGASVTLDISGDYPPARNIASAVDNIRRQLGKRSGVYSFHVMSVDDTDVRFYPLSVLNGFRRELAAMLDERMAEIMAAGRRAFKPTGAALPPQKRKAEDGVLMRSRYCIRYELGLCPKFGKRADGRLLRQDFEEPLFLVNNGRRLQLAFDCKACEMKVLN